MGVAAAATGVLALGFHGVGDALKALNDFQIDPTDAHLKKLNQTMQKIGPSGAEFVHFLDSLGPVMNELSNTARAGMFPGIEERHHASDAARPRGEADRRRARRRHRPAGGRGRQEPGGPEVPGVLQLARERREADPPRLGPHRRQHVRGHHQPVPGVHWRVGRFSEGLLEMSRSFAEWSRTLDTNQSFQKFLAYVDSAGPDALAFLGQLIQAIAAFAEAAAPVGSVMLPAMTELLKMFAEVAATPLGSTMIALGAAMSVYGRAVAIGTNLTTGLDKKFGMVNATALRTAFSFKR
jgi:hypothetical protein